jgi:rhamnosyltransferase
LIPKDIRIVAVIVTFNPSLPELTSLVSWLKNRVLRTVLVDNFSENRESIQDLVANRNSQSVVLHNQSANLGIATAQNIGIAQAESIEASHVVFFDQDSQPLGEMIEQLAAAFKLKETQGFKVGCVGPNYSDSRQKNPPPFISVKGLKLIRHTCEGAASIVGVDYLISSGSLISIQCLRTVGGMREDLFIDYVDIEWGLRAKTQGFLSFGVCGAQMAHQLGDHPLQIFNRRIPVHSPLRHYYHFRNAVLLYRDPSIALNWKAVDLSRLVLKYCVYSLFAKPRLKHFGMMSKGLVDGLRGVGGQFRQ